MTAADGDEQPTYRCVSIRPGLDACKAAWLLVGERFLPDQQPELPLAGCDRAVCDCAFNEHDDRREPGERRGSDEEDSSDPSDGPEQQRRSRGRRAEDRD